MAKIESYMMGFNPTTQRGKIQFKTVGNPKVYELTNLPASEFNAITAVLSSDSAHAEGQWIHTGIESASMKAAAFETPSREG